MTITDIIVRHYPHKLVDILTKSASFFSLEGIFVSSLILNSKNKNHNNIFYWIVILSICRMFIKAFNNQMTTFIESEKRIKRNELTI